MRLNEAGGEPKSGVPIVAEGADPVVSNAFGRFKLEFPQHQPGDTVVLTVGLEGWVAVNEVELRRSIPSSALGSPVEIVVCKTAEREQWALKYYRLAGQRLVDATYQRRIEELEQHPGITAQERQRLQQKRAEAMAQSEQLARELATTDPRQHGDDHRRAARQLLDGNLDGALASLSNALQGRASEPAPTHDSIVGSEIGNYRILSVLGKGGMGAVLLAEHKFLQRPVALKLLHPSYARDPGISQRFFQEAKAADEIGHESIVKILDFGKNVDGTDYLVMELLDGETLAQRLRRGALAELEAAQLMEQASDALVAAHAKGIVHRDLKPDNIFLTRERIKIVDFGIAKVRSSSVQTGVRAILGTPQYMAPEQIKGARFVGPHTDVYALGIILFEMVAGHAPFSDPDIDAIFGKHLFEKPPSLGEAAPVSPAFSRLVMRCLEKEPSARPTMIELRNELHELAGGAPEKALPRPREELVIEARVPSVPRKDQTPLMAPVESGSGLVPSLPDIPAGLVPPTPPAPSSPSIRGELQTRPRRRSRRSLQAAFSVAALVIVGGVIMTMAIVSRNSDSVREDPAASPEPPSESSIKPPPVEIKAAPVRPKELEALEPLAGAFTYTGYCHRQLCNGEPCYCDGAENVRAGKKVKETGTVSCHWTSDRTSLGCDVQNTIAKNTNHFGFAIRWLPERRLYQRVTVVDPDDADDGTMLDDGKLIFESRTRQLKTTYDLSHPTAIKEIDEVKASDGSWLLLSEDVYTSSSEPSPRVNSPADKLLQDAQDEYVHGMYAAAIETAMKATKAEPVRAWRIIGAASCFLKDHNGALQAWNKIGPQERSFLRYVCQRNAITLP